MRFRGCSIKVSVFTSRQPLHSAEIRSNSDLIQFRAATMPWADVEAPGLLTESVLRVPKLTSFSSVCCTLWGEIALMICVMTGSRSRFGLGTAFSLGAGPADLRDFGCGRWATARDRGGIKSTV